jgi:SAM-dependent methyltransferase
LEQNVESKEYGACTFELNGMIIQQRISKITPTKIGQFVTIWKRNMDGITEPFDNSDNFDFVINISTVEEVNYNHWIIFNNLLDQVKVGGYLIITFDLPGLDLKLFEKKIGVSLKKEGNILNGVNSKVVNTNFYFLNCGILIVKKK